MASVPAGSRRARIARRWRVLVVGASILAATACASPRPLRFPAAPAEVRGAERWYDVSGDGRVDFAVERVSTATPARPTIRYDDDGDGAVDRAYHLDEFARDDVPHLVILIDSIPFDAVARAHADGRFILFDAPQKVIAPFPSMSGLTFSQILETSPAAGSINRHYDRRKGRIDNRIVARVFGEVSPWLRRMHYHASYVENGMMFLEPRRWFRKELERVRQALDESPDRVTLAYMASAAGMMYEYGEEALPEIIDGLERLSLALLHERDGALRISMLSDHGHSLERGRWIDIERILEDGGFHPANALRNDEDVIVEMDGLLNLVGLHTRSPGRLARMLARHESFDFAAYVDGDCVVISSGESEARVRKRGDRYAFEPVSGDVWGYRAIVAELESSGALDEDGASSAAWLAATADHAWPDAVVRLWDAFHGNTVNTPTVYANLASGHVVGLAMFASMVEAASTHGGLGQLDSAAFVMTMGGDLRGPVRSRRLLARIEPSYTPDRMPR